MLGMESSDVDLKDFLRAFGTTYGQWSDSSRRVELTADFGAPGGDAEKQHNNAQTVQGINSAKLMQLFADAAQLGVSDVDLAKAAQVSPIELRNARDGLG